MQARNIKGLTGTSIVDSGRTAVNQNRHAAACLICQHSNLLDIELDFTHWLSYREIMLRYYPDRPTTDESMITFRQSLYRHAQVFGLDKKRNSNVLAALGRIAERGLDSLNGQKIAPHTTIEALKEISKIKEDSAPVESNQADIPDSRDSLLRELGEYFGQDNVNPEKAE